VKPRKKRKNFAHKGEERSLKKHAFGEDHVSATQETADLLRAHNMRGPVAIGLPERPKKKPKRKEACSLPAAGDWNQIADGGKEEEQRQFWGRYLEKGGVRENLRVSDESQSRNQSRRGGSCKRPGEDGSSLLIKYKNI